MWFFIGILGTLTLVIGARLVDIQVVNASQYAALVDVVSPKQIAYIRPPRGSILDRNGRVLVADEPSADVTMYYSVLKLDGTYLQRRAERALYHGEISGDLTPEAVVAQYKREIDQIFIRLAEITGTPRTEIKDRIDHLVDRVTRIRKKVGQPIREEKMWHPIIEDLDQATALRIQIELPDSPWIRIQPGSRRRSHDVDAVAHLIGRMGILRKDRLAQFYTDPYAGDELRELGVRDRHGIGGIELLAESELRGKRGKFMQNFATGVKERIPPEPGTDVVLTIDMDVQEQIYDLLVKAVADSPHPAGAAAVVLDVDSREVIAAVSYPSYSYEDFSENAGALYADTLLTPTRARAIQNRYPPGSTCKAITTFGALADAVASPAEKLHCTGHLLPNKPNKFRCWIYKQFGVTHDSEYPSGQTAADAIRNSCNIYFFRVGERLGADRLCHWFSEFGLGRGAGTGLIEEASGVVPTREWLAKNPKRKVQPSDPWNWSIGQGEVSMTPLQVANVAATIASGEWRPVTIAQTRDGKRLGDHDLPPRQIPAAALRPVRQGMYRVVNEDGGTAFDYARLDNNEFADTKFCGKTGSAQTSRRVLSRRYYFEYEDGRREIIVAPTKELAEEQFSDPKPKLVGHRAVDVFPTPTEENPGLPAHAWFMGYTQSADTPIGGTPRGKSYAISVLIEFGGSGGRVAGPVAKQIVELLLTQKQAAG